MRSLAGALRGPAELVLAELPLLALSAVLLSTAADIFPADALVGAGPLQITVSRIVIAVGLIALVARHGLRREHFLTGLELPLALLLVVSLVASLKWGTGPRFRFLLESVALFYLAVAVLRTRRDARSAVVLVALVAAAMAGLDAIAQVSQDSATGFYRDGCIPVTQPFGEAPPGTVTRAIGTFANPNVLAGYLLLVLPVAGVALSGPSSAIRQLRTPTALVLALGYLAILLTYSRAAVVVALLALGAAFISSGVRRRAYLVAIAAALAIALGVLAGACGSDATAGYGRGKEWRDTISVIADHPLIGVGPGRLGTVLHRRDRRSSARHAHNLFLTWWAEAGTGALIAWLWLAAMLIWRSLRGSRRGQPGSAGAFTALVGFFAFSMLDHPANVDRVALAFWVVAAFAAAQTGGWRSPLPWRGRKTEDEAAQEAGSIASGAP